MTFSSSPKTITALLLGMALLLLGLASSAQAAAPAWTLTIAHSPFSFERLEENGDYPVAYKVTVKNSGDAATVGNYVLYDTPPPELTVTEVRAGAGWICTAAGQANTGTPISCESEASLAPGASSLAVTVFLQMSPSAPDTLTNGATISGGEAAAEASASDPTPVIDRAPFEVRNFTARATDQADSDYTVAGGHPFQAMAGFEFPIYQSLSSSNGTTQPYPVQTVKDAFTELPPGFIGNPATTPRCSLKQFISFFVICPLGSRVGTVDIGTFGKAPALEPKPLYNVFPEPGYPAEFAFKYLTSAVALYPKLQPRTESYGLTIGTPGAARIGVSGVRVHLFGVPSTQNGFGGPKKPFLSNPVNCSEAHPVTNVAIDSWEHPGAVLPNGFPDLSDSNWKTASAANPPVTECDAPTLASQFDPSIDAKPVQEGIGVQANQPAGLKVDLDFPQTNDPTDPTTEFDPSIPQAPELKDATVTLPAGVSISPSAADGLDGCSDLASDPAGDQVHYDNTKPVSCPDASRIGTVTATSPLLALHDPTTDAVTGPEPIGGDVYLIKPHPGDLPQGANQDGTYRLLIQIESAERGINVKLPGTTKADKASGQLTATFTDNPQLPVSHLTLNLKSGPRAPLATPKICGTYTTTTDLVPWSTPGTPDAHPESSFAVDSACPNSLGERPFNPALSAGTENATAGAASPFVMHLTRKDDEQEFNSIDATLPAGFTAKLAGIPYCSEAEIATAAGRSGAAEQASPSCPAASQVGTLTTGAGPGSDPYYVNGKAYLSGPYKGAPLSFAFITPAVAGPFDLGNVVVRAAAFINPETAQVTVKTDSIPQILDGVPLGIRSIAVKVDRPGFTLNPTNCEAKSVNLAVGGASGATASPANMFQVGNCAALGFSPKLKLNLKGGTKRGKYPALRAVLTQPAGQANIGRVSVALPHSEFLAQEHIRTVCTRVQFAANACPAGSIYGYAKAWTPLLAEPLEGPVYLRSSSHELPDIVAALHGQVDVDLVGRIDSVHGGIRNTFETVPDAPVTRFELQMQGGKKGLLVNSRDICKQTSKVTVKATGQNGRLSNTKPVLQAQCAGHKKAEGHGRRK